jgi:hypothetical protein
MFFMKHDLRGVLKYRLYGNWTIEISPMFKFHCYFEVSRNHNGIWTILLNFQDVRVRVREK